jgi:hypothetical protein
MKKIVAIMAVSLMLFTSCGQIKELVGINKGSEGSGTIGGTLPTPPTPAAEKTFWKKWRLGIGAGSLLVIGSVIYLIDQCCCGKIPKAPTPQNNSQPGAPADPAVRGEAPSADNPGVAVGGANAGGNAGS